MPPRLSPLFAQVQVFAPRLRGRRADADSGAERCRALAADRGELIEASSCARNSLEELHIKLQPVPWLGLLVSLPSLAVRLMLLVRRQPVHPMTLQDAVHGGARNRYLMEPLQIRRNPGRAEVIVLAQVRILLIMNAHHPMPDGYGLAFGLPAQNFLIASADSSG